MVYTESSNSPELTKKKLKTEKQGEDLQSKVVLKRERRKSTKRKRKKRKLSQRTPESSLAEKRGCQKEPAKRKS